MDVIQGTIDQLDNLSHQMKRLRDEFEQRRDKAEAAIAALEALGVAVKDMVSIGPAATMPETMPTPASRRMMPGWTQAHHVKYLRNRHHKRPTQIAAVMGIPVATVRDILA